MTPLTRNDVTAYKRAGGEEKREEEEEEVPTGLMPLRKYGF